MTGSFALDSDGDGGNFSRSLCGIFNSFKFFLIFSRPRRRLSIFTSGLFLRFSKVYVYKSFKKSACRLSRLSPTWDPHWQCSTTALRYATRIWRDGVGRRRCIGTETGIGTRNVERVRVRSADRDRTETGTSLRFNYTQRCWGSRRSSIRPQLPGQGPSVRGPSNATCQCTCTKESDLTSVAVAVAVAVSFSVFWPAWEPNWARSNCRCHLPSVYELLSCYCCCSCCCCCSFCLRLAIRVQWSVFLILCIIELMPSALSVDDDPSL